MALEDLTGPSKYIDALVNTNPVGPSDRVKSLDDHIRGMKNVLLNSLPNITGAVTADQTELNILDGATLTTAELNLLVGLTNSLSGLTATAAELNKLDGATVTTAEINRLDGNIRTVLENFGVFYGSVSPDNLPSGWSAAYSSNRWLMTHNLGLGDPDGDLVWAGSTLIGSLSGESGVITFHTDNHTANTTEVWLRGPSGSFAFTGFHFIAIQSL